MHWVCRQRLEQARWSLLHPEHGDSVGSIARRGGFRGLSVFSRDILALFGVRPLDLLRDAHRRHDSVCKERDGGGSALTGAIG